MIGHEGLPSCRKHHQLDIKVNLDRLSLRWLRCSGITLASREAAFLTDLAVDVDSLGTWEDCVPERFWLTISVPSSGIAVPKVSCALSRLPPSDRDVRLVVKFDADRCYLESGQLPGVAGEAGVRAASAVDEHHAVLLAGAETDLVERAAADLARRGDDADLLAADVTSVVQDTVRAVDGVTVSDG